MNADLFAKTGRAPETSTALLRELATGADSVRWTEFVELYTPFLHCALQGMRKGRLPWLSPEMFDDIVQETFVSIAKTFPGGGYRRDKARFRTFLSSILWNRAVDFLRKSHNRNLRFLPDDRLRAALDAAPENCFAPDADSPERRELRSRLWSLMVERVFRESNFSGRSQAIFRRLAAGESPDALSAEFGLEKNAVYQLKNRVMKALAAKARELSRESNDLLDLVFALESRQGETSHD